MKSDLWKNLDDKQAQTLTGGMNYCGDEFSDYGPDCLRYDAGADLFSVSLIKRIDKSTPLIAKALTKNT